MSKDSDKDLHDHIEDSTDQDILDFIRGSKNPDPPTKPKNISFKINKAKPDTGQKEVIDPDIRQKIESVTKLDNPDKETPKTESGQIFKDLGSKQTREFESFVVEDEPDVAIAETPDIGKGPVSDEVRTSDKKATKKEKREAKRKQKAEKARTKQQSKKEKSGKKSSGHIKLTKADSDKRGSLKDAFKNEKIEKTAEEKTDTDVLIEKKYRSMRIKKIVTTVIVLTTLLAILVFGIYNTFLKPEKSAAQITAEVNAVNRTTPFPTDGIEGFLKQNVVAMMEENVKLQKGVDKYKVEPYDLHVTSVSKRSSYIANVYFTVKIKTNTGANYHNFFVALKYDYKNYAYTPASEVRPTPVQPEDNIKISDNDMLSFQGIPEANEKDNTKAQTFTQNFLMMMFNEDVDISPYYTGGTPLGDPNAKFVRIEDFQLYTDYNKNRYNAKVVYVLSLNEGIEYTVTNYLDIRPSGSSYIINAIL